jgi:hypothetical protein
METALFLVSLIFMTIILAAAQKWAGMNPHRIEDGPSWLWAFASALYTMALLTLAIILHVNGYRQASAFFGPFAFGSAIGGCFLTQFKPSPEHVPNAILRWWKGKLSAIADSVGKSMIVVPVGALVSWATSLDGRYWVAVTLAFWFLLGRARIASNYLAPFWLGGTTGGLSCATRSKIDAYVDTLLARGRKGNTECEQAVAKLRELMQELKFNEDVARAAEAEFRLHTARQHMLIGGSLMLTVIVGILCLTVWLGITRHLMVDWEEARSSEYLAGAIGFVAGVAFQFR